MLFILTHLSYTLMIFSNRKGEIDSYRLKHLPLSTLYLYIVEILVSLTNNSFMICFFPKFSKIEYLSLLIYPASHTSVELRYWTSCSLQILPLIHGLTFLPIYYTCKVKQTQVLLKVILCRINNSWIFMLIMEGLLIIFWGTLSIFLFRKNLYILFLSDPASTRRY